MNNKENIYAGLDDRLDNEIREKISLQKNYFLGEDIDIDRLIELEKSVIRLTQLQREKNLKQTKKILLDSITPSLEKKLRDFELTQGRPTCEGLS